MALRSLMWPFRKCVQWNSNPTVTQRESRLHGQINWEKTRSTFPFPSGIVRVENSSVTLNESHDSGTWLSFLDQWSYPGWPHTVFLALNTMYCADNFSVCISSPHLSSEHQTECSQFPQRHRRDIWTFIFPQPPPSGLPSSAHGNFTLQVTQAKNLSILHDSSTSPIPHI